VAGGLDCRAGRRRAVGVGETQRRLHHAQTALRLRHRGRHHPPVCQSLRLPFFLQGARTRSILRVFAENSAVLSPGGIHPNVKRRPALAVLRARAL
jgi:hypothetical protein